MRRVPAAGVVGEVQALWEKSRRCGRSPGVVGTSRRCGEVEALWQKVQLKVLLRSPRGAVCDDDQTEVCNQWDRWRSVLSGG